MYTTIKRLLLAVVFLLIACSETEEKKDVEAQYFDLVRRKYTGDLAYVTTDYVAQYWRVVGNTGFNKSITWITNHLDEVGYVLESNATSKDRLTYRIEKRPLERPTWEPVSASVGFKGDSLSFLNSDTNRNMIYLNSTSTPEGGITAELVEITKDTDVDQLHLKDNIVFTEIPSRKLLNTLIEKDVLGIISYNNPNYLQPEKNTTSIQFRRLPSSIEQPFWGIALSYAAKEHIKERLAKGKTEVYVQIQTKIYTSEELTVVANVKGSRFPEERLVFSAHIQEPGANDNATGVGAQLEMAKVISSLLKSKEISVDRTLTFIWGDEIVSTRRYIEEDKKRANNIKWGISLDMVGENTAVTGGSFLIEKMPDPSAIWTRGNDKHTEWGGRVLTLEDMKPHYLNDFIFNIFKKQGEYANWQVATNPFEGGSDHTPFLKADIPGLLLWHFTDQFYHTDNDRIDKVSKETLTNVGTGALVAGLMLVNANEQTALTTLCKGKADALKRLETEFNLSKEAIRNGEAKEEQMSILKAWVEWYVQAFSSVNDMVANPSENLKKELDKSITELQNVGKEYEKHL